MTFCCRSETRKRGISTAEDGKQGTWNVYIYICVRTIKYRNSTKTERCREIIVAKDERKKQCDNQWKITRKKKKGKCEQILSR
jgi:hypothetical protein